MKTIRSNNNGTVLLMTLTLFLIFNVIFLGLLNDQIRFLKTSRYSIEKDKAMLLSSSGLNIALAEIVDNNYFGSIILQDQPGKIVVKITVRHDGLFNVESEGSFGKAKSRVIAIVEKNEDNKIAIIERRIW